MRLAAGRLHVVGETRIMQTDCIRVPRSLTHVVHHQLLNRTTENSRVPDGATLGLYGLGCIGMKVWRNARGRSKSTSAHKGFLQENELASRMLSALVS